MSDVMDEFEFKPLTNGLGFHNRRKKSELEPGPLRKESITGFSTPQGFSQPLTSRPSYQQRSSLSEEMPSTTVDEILRTLNAKKRPEMATNEKKMLHQADKPKYVRTQWEFSAFLLDLTLVMAANLSA